MRKPPGNPIVEVLSKSWTKRSIDLTKLKPLIVGEGKQAIKHCAWCAEPFRGLKYCGDECSTAAQAWAYPQKEAGLYLLLVEQDWKCKLCGYSYVDDYRQAMESSYGVEGAKRFGVDKFMWHIVKKLKDRVVKDRKPEVDHIVPVSKGGQSIGNSNHQIICYTCHKEKSKKDNSGPRKKKT